MSARRRGDRPANAAQRRSANLPRGKSRAPPSAAGWTDIVVAVVCDGDDVLVTRRAAGTHLGDFDEFPGGKREGDEALEAACVREVREETGIAIAVEKLLAASWFEGDGKRLALSFFACRPIGSREPTPEAAKSRAARWVARRELATLRFPPANAQVVAQLVAAPSTSRSELA